MVWIGYALLAVAAGWFLWKVYVSYTSAGGTDMMVPVYDAAMYPPMLMAVGLYLVLHNRQVDWPVWMFVLIWIGGTALAAGTIKLAELLGDKPL